ncbi:Asp-tRNA(Asn)/Glu-tRNA(Gln) amidotransferase subunit GatC [Clostridium fallax]|uniref:Aspartyl/glutamyl-tRNA(Asn/Gln) amidotransferase subunit C n=1 Tax=Clostridium fallax TaxID=1533 RepID=A0A1M4YXJ4_9CLOT|nr:Asp-tRNA(Asn)/Glu-tRNA(Gln) amidotransferase subunit GatC [Clostridium fallax]SHF10277.1 aspartyl/glutamyl-tRNA(Asn/Gln) amidotransferase subunit C [Clostridium fallax]SQB22277.1 aspartyl/glutamyl-tRNA amidotransferase subunit C [Clostridium fallax]
MLITKSDLDYLEILSKLSFDEKEKEKLLEDLNEFLQYVDKINEINTKDIEITVNPYYIENKFREDEIEEYKNIENIMENAPEHFKSYIVVPKVID